MNLPNLRLKTTLNEAKLQALARWAGNTLARAGLCSAFVLAPVCATAAEFGVENDGTLYHIDGGQTAAWHYLCIDGDCRPGVLANGRYQRQVSVNATQRYFIEFKVQDNDSGQCIASANHIAPGEGVDNSPCGNDNGGGSNGGGGNGGGGPQPPGGDSNPYGAGLISTSGDTITTELAERFRNRHESDADHDNYIAEYALGSAYQIVLIDRPNELEVQIHSDEPLSMVNFTYDHIINPGFADPPQFRGGGFMRKGSINGPADDSAGNMVNSLYFVVTERWAERRTNNEIFTLEFTPRRQLHGNFPQYYSDILRYRAGLGGVTFERDDVRYFSAGPTTNFAHGTVGMELSQAFLGIDVDNLHEFTLGRELFRASFLGDPLPGNGGRATGADSNAAEDACLACHFNLGKGAPPGVGSSEVQGFINSGGDLRIAPALVGLGLLEAVDQSTLDSFGGKAGLGRFGWKATEPSIRDQVVKAFANDMGVTSEEVSSTFVDRIVTYIQTLGVPIRRHPDAQAAQQPNVALRVADEQTITDADVLAGEAAFTQAGCHGCHIPEMQTGNSHPIRQFRNITIRPFTDMKLWDMGPELASDSGEGNATAREWRTAPLWGSRLQERITGHSRFLHDGRARSRDEAIRLHGGDAAAARDTYLNMPASQRESLILFLRTL